MDSKTSMMLREKVKEIDNLIAIAQTKKDALNFEIEKDTNSKLAYEDIRYLDSKKLGFRSLSDEYRTLSSLRICWKRIGEAYDGSLTRLYLSGLMLKEIPPEIKLLTNLKFLDIRKNRLTTLPQEIGYLKNLESLYIDFNQVAILPPEIGQLASLQSLGAISNILTTLPVEIGKLSNLTYLHLGGNQLTSLPRNIAHLLNLETLILAENRIAALNPEITQLNNLKYINLHNNPLPIPPEILMGSRSPMVIFDYYFLRQDSAKRPLNEAKVIFVGQGSVGKSSIVQRLLYNTFDQNQAKTEGIFLCKWQVKQVNASSIRINIWDFGGQEIMHATHQFFLTKRSLYVLVLDCRNSPEQNEVEYWLRIINSFGSNAPVIVVGNKIDQQPLDIDRRGLQAKYPNIKAFLETSCLDGKGIKELHNAIIREISTLQHLHDDVPESWFDVKEKLEKLGKDFIPYSEYESLCNEYGVTGEASQSTLIGFLHDLGTALNFRDDPRLEETNILNPEWVTNSVYRILNSHELFHNKGVLETKQLDKILDRKAYPRSRHMFIVDMMRKFELCYPFEGEGSKYLVPDLLPREEPFTGEWGNA